MREKERETERKRVRECGTTVDSESHLASRLLFIVPCYSGFPRQSGRDAIKKKRKTERKCVKVRWEGKGREALKNEQLFEMRTHMRATTTHLSRVSSESRKYCNRYNDGLLFIVSDVEHQTISICRVSHRLDERLDNLL